VNEDTIEAAAVASAANHGTPDISGGYFIEGGVVVFQDKDGHPTMYMDEDAFNSWLEIFHEKSFT
jgi:hypothetical protein